MSDIDSTNPFAPPTAVVADKVDPAELVAGGELASRWSRFWAAMIDGLISGALTWVASKVLHIEWFTDHPTLGNLWPLTLASYGLFVVVQGGFLHQRNQTIGKMALGIRIRRTDGSHASLSRLLGLRQGVSWLVTLVPVVGPYLSVVDTLFIFGKSRRCLHDLIADTVVVKV